MIRSLQSLRGIFALVIICYHYYSRAPMVVDATACGVAFFFIMSGFALGLNHHVDTLKGFNLVTFMRNRLAKLYPIHLVLTLAMIYFIGINWKLWINIFLIQSWFTEESVWFSYNGTSWFVSSLMFCYLFFGLFSYMSHRIKPIYCLTVLAIAAAALVASYFITPASVHSWLYYTFPVTRLIDFGLGITLAHIYNRSTTPPSEHRRSWGLIATVALVLVLVLIVWPHGSPLARVCFLSVVWYAPLALLIITLSKAEHNRSTLTRILSWKPLVWLGGISFEMYMWQVLMHCIVCKLGVIFTGHKFMPELHICIIIALIIPLAWLTQRYFTVPIARWIKRQPPQ